MVLLFRFDAGLFHDLALLGDFAAYRGLKFRRIITGCRTLRAGFVILVILMNRRMIGFE